MGFFFSGKVHRLVYVLSCYYVGLSQTFPVKTVLMENGVL